MYANFGDDQLRGLGVAVDRISHFTVDLSRRPYNTLALPCECVITFIKLLLVLGNSLKIYRD